MDRAINNLLKIVTEYFEGDRSYIVKVDYENQLVHNTYEHAAPGITKEIDNLQQVPLQVVQSWLDKFQKHGMFYISDLDREKEKEAKTYDILKAQNINSLIAVPFKKDGTVIGFFWCRQSTEILPGFSAPLFHSVLSHEPSGDEGPPGTASVFKLPRSADESV